jgi:hypothetical protein
MTVRTHRGASTRRSGRPRWLAPLAVAAVIAAVLVLAGVVALSTVFYAGLFGGMILMHVGRHGHGGHGAGHEAHAAEEPDETGPDAGPATAVDRPHGGCH